MLEKRWIAVPPQLFTANGTTDGQIKVVDSTLFKVKQTVIILSNTISSREDLEVKRITDANTIYVGPKSGNIDSRTDLSQYLTADNASIAANEQLRSKVPEQEIERHTYEEEPVVARRVVMVDQLGNKYGPGNPLPIAFDGTIAVGAVTIKDSDGDELAIEPDGSINVNTTSLPLPSGAATEAKQDAGNASLASIDSKLSNLDVNVDAMDEPTSPDNVMMVGSDNGQKTGNKFAFINNVKNQILATEDRVQSITYADFGTKNQRIIQIDYTSPTFPTVVAQKIINYSLVGTRYRRDSIVWNVI